MSFLLERLKKSVALTDCEDSKNKIDIDIAAWNQVKDYVFENFDKRLAEVNQCIKWHRLSTQIE